MGGRADRVYERCVRLDVGMRGFGGKLTSKLKTKPSTEGLESSGNCQHRNRGEYVCSVAIIITGKYSRTTQPKNRGAKKIDSMVVWDNVPRPVGMGTNACLLRINKL